MALARYLPSFVKDGPWDDARDAAALFGAIGAVGWSGPELGAGNDPAFETATAHRTAYAAMPAARGGDSVAFDAVQPVGTGALLRLAIDLHAYAYAERRRSALEGAPDASANAAAEWEAFRALLGIPLVTDADRAAFATAVLERASGSLAEECWRKDPAAPLVLAFRNLAYGENALTPEQRQPFAAE